MFKQQQLIRFLIVMGSLCCLWFAVYEFVLKPHGLLDQYLTRWVCFGVDKALHFTGFDSYYYFSRKTGNALVFIAPSLKPAVRIGASCNGQELFALFILFIISYPGKWSIKVPFIISGLFLIHIANLFRTYCLVLLAHNHSVYYDLFHRYIFIFFIYGIVFLMWMVWANKYSKLK